MKSLRHKLTFVIIPEANQSVFRLKLSRAAAYALLSGTALLLSTACCIYVSHMKSAVVVHQMKSEMKGRTVQLEQDVAKKSRTIDELQNELFELSRQAADIKNKVEEMKKLESDLKAGAADSGAAVSLAQPAMLPSASSTDPALGGMGGPMVPVTLEQTKELAGWTRSMLGLIAAETSILHEHLEKAKQAAVNRELNVRKTPTLWPTVSRTVTSAFGYRNDPFTAKASFHRGIDIAGKSGDPVFTTADGIVHTVGYDQFHGHNVVIEHSGGLRTWYMHLKKASVHQGEAVTKGQTIGQLGSTGRSTGPHLHYEILKNGKSTNPKPYMPGPDTKGGKR